MGWLPVLLAGAAAYLLYESGHFVLFTLAVLAAIGCFWSWGIMHNYATDATHQRPTYRGGFNDITEAETAAVPNRIAKINLGFSLAALVLLVTAIIILI